MMRSINTLPECELLHDDTDKVIKFIWADKPITNDRFKEILNHLVGFTQRLTTKYLYVDARLLKYLLSPEIQDWHDQTIIPQYKKAGVQAMAFLIPNHIFTEVTHKKTFQKENATQSIQTAFFKNEPDLLAWFSNLGKQAVLAN